jgi:hypothetical protein
MTASDSSGSDACFRPWEAGWQRFTLQDGLVRSEHCDAVGPVGQEFDPRYVAVFHPDVGPAAASGLYLDPLDATPRINDGDVSASLGLPLDDGEIAVA